MRRSDSPVQIPHFSSVVKSPPSRLREGRFSVTRRDVGLPRHRAFLERCGGSRFASDTSPLVIVTRMKWQMLTSAMRQRSGRSLLVEIGIHR